MSDEAIFSLIEVIVLVVTVVTIVFIWKRRKRKAMEFYKSYPQINQTQTPPQQTQTFQPSQPIQIQMPSTNSSHNPTKNKKIDTNVASFIEEQRHLNNQMVTLLNSMSVQITQLNNIFSNPNTKFLEKNIELSHLHAINERLNMMMNEVNDSYKQIAESSNAKYTLILDTLEGIVKKNLKESLQKKVTEEEMLKLKPKREEQKEKGKKKR